MAILSYQQRAYLDALAELGDRDLARKRYDIDLLIYNDWLQEDEDFKRLDRLTYENYLDRLKDGIELRGLQNLHYALVHGEKIVTNTTERKKMYSLDGDEIGTEVKTKQTIKQNKVLRWAVKEALLIHFARKTEQDFLNNFKQLAAAGMAPENAEEAISGYLDEFRSRVKNFWSQDMQEIEITDDLLAEIQQRVIGQS